MRCCFNEPLVALLEECPIVPAEGPLGLFFGNYPQILDLAAISWERGWSLGELGIEVGALGERLFCGREGRST
jgi:hypothetical protein